MQRVLAPTTPALIPFVEHRAGEPLRRTNDGLTSAAIGVLIAKSGAGYPIRSVQISSNKAADHNRHSDGKQGGFNAGG